MSWNLLLDENDGPHNGGCTNCHGVITMRNDSYSVSHNEPYFGLKHFGKFINGNMGMSYRLNVDVTIDGKSKNIDDVNCTDAVAIINRNDSNSLNIIVKNFCDKNINVNVVRLKQDNTIEYVNTVIPPGLATIFWSTYFSTYQNTEGSDNVCRECCGETSNSSGTVIDGVLIGVGLALVILIPIFGGVIWYVRKKKKAPQTPQKNQDNKYMSIIEEENESNFTGEAFIANSIN